MKLWEEIESAEKRIRNAILRTPMICSDTLSTLTGQEVFLKLENLQKGGSFKIRGAYNKLSQLTFSTSSTNERTEISPSDSQGSSWSWRPVVPTTSERSKKD